MIPLRVAVAGLAALALAARPAVADEPDPRSCLSRIDPLPAKALVREAVQQLERAGHDPALYRAELRREDATRPDAAGLGPRLVTSVVFRPLADGDYSLRVHPAIPCGVGWVWEPESFTPWQAAVVNRAGAAAREARPASAGEPREVQVAESRERVAVYVWTAGSDAASEPAWTVILRKADLAVLRVD